MDNAASIIVQIAADTRQLRRGLEEMKSQSYRAAKETASHWKQAAEGVEHGFRHMAGIGRGALVFAGAAKGVEFLADAIQLAGKRSEGLRDRLEGLHLGIEGVKADIGEFVGDRLVAFLDLRGSLDEYAEAVQQARRQEKVFEDEQKRLPRTFESRAAMFAELAQLGPQRGLTRDQVVARESAKRDRELAEEDDRHLRRRKEIGQVLETEFREELRAEEQRRNGLAVARIRAREREALEEDLHERWKRTVELQRSGIDLDIEGGALDPTNREAVRRQRMRELNEKFIRRREDAGHDLSLSEEERRSQRDQLLDQWGRAWKNERDRQRMEIDRARESSRRSMHEEDQAWEIRRLRLMGRGRESDRAEIDARYEGMIRDVYKDQSLSVDEAERRAAQLESRREEERRLLDRDRGWSKGSPVLLPGGIGLGGSGGELMKQVFGGARSLEQQQVDVAKATGKKIDDTNTILGRIERKIGQPVAAVLS